MIGVVACIGFELNYHRGVSAPNLTELAAEVNRYNLGAMDGNSPESNAVKIWNSLQCGKALQNAKIACRQEGKTFEAFLSEAKIPVKTASRHIALSRNLPQVTSFNDVLEKGFGSLRQLRIELGIDSDPKKPDVTPEQVSEEDKVEGNFRSVEDAEFLRDTKNGVWMFRVSALGAAGQKFTPQRHEISLRTKDPEQAANMRDILLEFMSKVGIMTERTKQKIAEFQAA